MNKLQHICLHGFLAVVLLLFPFYCAQAGGPASKSVSSAGAQTAGTTSQIVLPANAKIPLQEEIHYLTASQLAEEEGLLAILWVQRSAEFRGLSYQAYNLATMAVDKALALRREEEKTLRKTKAKKNVANQPGRLHPLAVVLDIDDTITCNASLRAYYIEHPEAKADYNAWEQWISQQNLLLPGARDFLKYADNRGIQIFYVTGRGPQDKIITEDFLHKAGLPFPDQSHLFMNDGSGSKMTQFAKLARRYDIICYLGDNVADFPIGAVRDENEVIYKEEADEYESGSSTTITGNTREIDTASKSEMQSGKHKTEIPLDIEAMLKQDKNAKRNRIIDVHKQSFGTKFILLPNPMYGDWEYNLAKKYRKLPGLQRITLRKAVIKGFACNKK
jgi:predicted secreted acid phosphatase